MAAALNPHEFQKSDRRIELAGLFLVVAVAAAVRFWQLQTIPPGLHYDEAFNNLFALRIYRGEIRPIFIPENSGEEPLHIYLTAMLFAVIGPTALGGRIVSAASGVLHVLVLYWTGREIFVGNLGRRAAGKIGLLAALFLATWYWPFHYSRVGMEPSMVPLVSAAAVLFAWRAIRTQRKRDAILAGAFTALGLYTYPAGRLIPFVVGLVIVYHIAIGRVATRPMAARLALAAGAALIVALPLGAYFLQNPDWFLLRVQQTSAVGGASPWAAIDKGLKSAVVGLILRGDENWRQNLPRRPIFDPAQFAIFVVGLAVCVWKVRRSPYWFLPLWAALGFLPTILSEFSPHFGRALGAAPPLAIICGLGLWKAGQVAAARLRSPAVAGSMLAAASIGLPLAYSSGLALNDYFNRWARSPELFIAFDAGLRAIGEYAVKLPREEPIYLSPIPRDWYTLTFAMKDDNQRLRSFNGRECLVLPLRTRYRTHEIIVVWRGEDQRSIARLQNIFPAGAIAWQLDYPGKGAYAVDFAVPPNQRARAEPEFARRANFNGHIALDGYDLSSRVVRPGDTITVNLWWRSIRPVSSNYTVFVHLLGQPLTPNGQTLWAQRDEWPCDNSYPTSRWSPDEIIWDDYRLKLPDNLPPGTYVVKTGLYELTSGQRLPVVSADIPLRDDVVTLTAIKITAP